MQKLQYWHYRLHYNPNKNYTVAIFQPSRTELEFLENLLYQGKDTTYSFKLGIAKMHHKEKHWIKKVGREVAARNLGSKLLKLEEIEIDAQRKQYHFIADDKTFKLTFLLSYGKQYAFMKDLYIYRK